MAVHGVNYSEKKKDPLIINKMFLNKLDQCNGYFKESDMPDEYAIIWPIVYKKNLTAIHYAQIRTILSLISPPGGIHDIILVTSGDDKSFQSKLIDCLSKNNISHSHIWIESVDYADINSPIFENIIKNISIQEVLNFKKKKYKDSRELDTDPIEKIIIPLMQFTKIISFDKKSLRNYILIAGKDETDQWDKLINIYSNDCDHTIKKILIPEMKDGDGNTVNQVELANKINDDDSDTLFNYLKKENRIYKWFAEMFTDEIVKEEIIVKDNVLDEIYENIRKIKAGNIEFEVTSDPQ